MEYWSPKPGRVGAVAKNYVDWLISTDAFLATLTQIHFNHVNKIEARYKLLRLNLKLSEILLLRLRATFHKLPLF